MPTKTVKTRRIKHVFDRVPDAPDARDFYAVPGPPVLTAAPPPLVDLSQGYPVRYDQGQIGSCTGNAGCAYRRWLSHAHALPEIDYSRLYLYYKEREIEGDTGQDAGAAFRDAAKTLQQGGVPPETLWPYDIRKFAVAPPDSLSAEAAKHKITSYARIPGTVAGMVKSLAAGVPVALGVSVFNGIESTPAARTGVVPVPKATETSIGGHEVFVVGYDARKRRIKFINSWGAAWGSGGCGFFPYAYFDHPAVRGSIDCWTITL